MYVPFGKSVDDVTFGLSLRHLFCPRLKKTMEHNLVGWPETGSDLPCGCFVTLPESFASSVGVPASGRYVGFVGWPGTGSGLPPGYSVGDRATSPSVPGRKCLFSLVVVWFPWQQLVILRGKPLKFN